MNNLDLRIYRTSIRPDGQIDVLGTAAAKALFVPNWPATNTIGSRRYFDPHCGATSSTVKVLDEIVRDAPLSTEPLVIGPALCADGRPEVVTARVASIETSLIPSSHLGKVWIDFDLAHDRCRAVRKISAKRSP